MDELTELLQAAYNAGEKKALQDEGYPNINAQTFEEFVDSNRDNYKKVAKAIRDSKSDEPERIYKIRVEVLNMPNEDWVKVEGNILLRTTFLQFTNKYSTDVRFLTAKLNEEEKEFCERFMEFVRKSAQ